MNKTIEYVARKKTVYGNRDDDDKGYFCESSDTQHKS